MYTVITKGNKVNRRHTATYGDVDDIIIINESGTALVNKGNPITWPTDATSGLQAIVDLKVCTLRFGMNNGPISRGEFVVSEYVEPTRQAATREEVMELVHTWPIHLERNGEEITKDWAWGGINGITAIVNQSTGETITENDWREYLVEILRKNQSITGTKHDQGKPILGAVPPHAELAVGRVLTFGAEKYARGNWDKVEDHENRYMDAALRHLNAHRRGELTDSESGESHLAHAACCILFMLDKQERP